LDEINENGIKKNDRKEVVEYDEKSVPLNIVSFLFPLIGIVLYTYFGWNNRYPIKSSSIGKWTFAGVCMGLLLFLLELYVLKIRYY
jgi:drug/metabolite transporter (DMT)-like permease